MIAAWMRDPRKTYLRRALFQIHLWTGIGVGLYVLAISLSGSALVFREELEEEHPAAARLVEVKGPRAPLEEVKNAVASRFPDYKVAWILEPDRPDLAHEVWFEKGTESRLALVDPYGARFLGEVGATTTFWTFLQDLHFYLFAGAVGLIVNGVGGALLFALCFTGVLIWWPGQRDWMRALNVNWGANWKRLTWDLHSAGGMWILAFTLIWALSGAYFAFPQPFLWAVEAVLPVAPTPASPPPVGERPLLPVDTLVEKARAEAPQGRITWVGLPHHEEDAMAIVYFMPAGSDDGYATTYVRLNPLTAEVLGVERPEDRRAGDKALEWFIRLHFGDFGGWPVKAIWTLLGLTPALLFISGFLMWWNRVLSKKWRRWEEATAGASARSAELARRT